MKNEETKYSVKPFFSPDETVYVSKAGVIAMKLIDEIQIYYAKEIAPRMQSTESANKREMIRDLGANIKSIVESKADSINQYKNLKDLLIQFQIGSKLLHAERVQNRSTFKFLSSLSPVETRSGLSKCIDRLLQNLQKEECGLDLIKEVKKLF